MLDLNDFYLFVQVVDRGGFTAAARVLQLPKSTPNHRARTRTWISSATISISRYVRIPIRYPIPASCNGCSRRRPGCYLPERATSRTARRLPLPTILHSLKQAAIEGCGLVALPAYVCRDAVSAERLRRVLPEWIAGDSTITALLTSRHGQLPSVRAFLDHLVAKFPRAVQGDIG